MSRPSGRQTTRPQRRVVIADAEPTMQQQLQAALPRPQYRVVGVADTAKQARHLAQQRRPDVLIVDIQMTRGRTDGREQVVLRPTFDGPVLIITAYSHSEIAGYGNMAGVGAYVIKPVRAGTFLPLLDLTIARVAEVRALHSELAAQSCLSTIS